MNIKMKTRSNGRFAALPSAAILASVVLLAGCSHSSDTTPSSASGAGPTTNAGAPPTTAGVQSNIEKIKADPNLTPAQKEIMLNEGQHALTKAQGGK